MSQVELGRRVAKRLGREPFSPATISQWFSGTVPQDLATIQAIAEELECSRDWLAFGDMPDIMVKPSALDVLVRSRMSRPSGPHSPAPPVVPDRKRRAANGD